MTIEKSYSEFILLHEKKCASKEINLLEKNIVDVTEKIKIILNPSAENDIKKISNNLIEEIKKIKKILNSHNLYEI